MGLSIANIAEGVGERVRRLRKAVGLSQTPFAVALGTQQGTVSNWETEATLVDRGWLRLMSDLVGNSEEVFAWLVEGGRTPKFLPIVSRGGEAERFEGERRAVAAWLRAKADELEGRPAAVKPDQLREALDRSLRAEQEERDRHRDAG